MKFLLKLPLNVFDGISKTKAREGIEPKKRLSVIKEYFLSPMVNTFISNWAKL